jgi:hypothetical protein
MGVRENFLYDFKGARSAPAATWPSDLEIDGDEASRHAALGCAG